ncbi:ABC transporter permease [Mesorhizobium sp. WSM4887]|uniref:ABC transporter permease n=1 Tax=Mesorhizobium sp. WSM4887 TaxID=3038543 RepID=UPI002415E52F|nr:ABC transporter permease [Mesorhizobium sp. WSM4887]
MLTPILVIVPVSFSSDRYISFPVPGYSSQWYLKMFESEGYRLAIWNTLVTGVAVAAVAGILGTLAALAIVRGKIRFGTALTGLAVAPLIMPQIIVAIGAYPIVAAAGLIGTKLGVILIHSAIALPLVFITVSSALRSYSPNMELAAMTLGANDWRTFIHVTWPMIRLGMTIGAIFAFAASFDEIIIALFLTDASSVTLPVYMWNELRFQMEPTIAAASTAAIVVSLSLLSAVALLQRTSNKKLNTQK